VVNIHHGSKMDNLPRNVFYKNNEIVGNYTSWFGNGTEQRICNYKNGKLRGLVRVYYNNRNLAEECYYKNNLQHGAYKCWYENGGFHRQDLYKNGIVIQNIKECMPVARNFKLLLLGCGNVGKSTIFSQMKVIHKGGFTDEEKLSMKRVAMDNVLQAMVSLIDGAHKLSIELDCNEHRIRADKILEAESSLEEASNIEEILPGVAEDITTLWKKDNGIKCAFEQQNKFQFNTCAEYFLNNTLRLSTPHFLPNDEDIIKCRGKTLGVVEMHFEVDNESFTIVDTGGERNERKKWIHCFEGVAVLIHVVNLEEFDMTLFEDGTTNRMLESLKLFDEVCNSRWFKDSHMILMLNMIDKFREKIKKI